MLRFEDYSAIGRRTGIGLGVTGVMLNLLFLMQGREIGWTNVVVIVGASLIGLVLYDACIRLALRPMMIRAARDHLAKTGIRQPTFIDMTRSELWRNRWPLTIVGAGAVLRFIWDHLFH